MRLFFILVLIHIVVVTIFRYVLVNDDLFYNGLSHQLSYERMDEMLDTTKKWEWLSYVMLPIILFLKIFLTATSLFTGALILGVETSFKKLMHEAVQAEFVMVLPGVVKLLWFSFVRLDYSLQDLQYFSPLSVFSLFNSAEVESWLIYPLQLLNLFEVAYWCVLAWLLRDVLNRDFAGSLGFVAGTYGMGLLLWIILVMFLTVSLT